MLDLDTMNQKNKEKGGFSHFMGMHIDSASKEEVICSFEPESHHSNPIGTVHGGALFSLADSTGGILCNHFSDHVTTLNASINYLAAGVNASRIYAVARPIKVGRTIIVNSVNIYNDQDKLLCEASFTYYVLDK